MKWEHRIIEVGSRMDGNHLRTQTETVEEAGKDGWELVEVMPAPDINQHGYGVYMYFKRQEPSQ